MKSFTDCTGRTWTVSVNVATIRAARKALDVNLADVWTGGLLEKLKADPVLLVDVLYVLCRQQADAEKVSDEDFGRAMAGDAIDRATAALLAEIADFAPAGKRRAMQRAIEKLAELEAKAEEAALAKLDSPEIDQQLEQALKAE